MEQKNMAFDLLLKSLNTAGIMEGNMEEIAILLSMEDSEFALISSIILQELRNSVARPEEKLLLTQALNASGTSMEEFIELYGNVLEAIDKEDFDGLSPIKKDFLKSLVSLVMNAVSDVEGASKRIVQIPIELCHKDAKMPTYANIGDAGMDVYAIEDIEVEPGQTVVVPLGIKVAVPMGFQLEARPKSGRAIQTKLRVANSPGTIDSGFRDEIAIIIDNIEPRIKDISFSEERKDGMLHPIYTITSIEYGRPFLIEKGKKFAQLVLTETPKASFFTVKDIKTIDGDRGGGFGSTGL